jgi:hypothetical protein
MGAVLGKVNDGLLNGIPEGPAHDLASSMLDKAEEEAGLSKGDSGSCHQD